MWERNISCLPYAPTGAEAATQACSLTRKRTCNFPVTGWLRYTWKLRKTEVMFLVVTRVYDRKWRAHWKDCISHRLLVKYYLKVASALYLLRPHWQSELDQAYLRRKHILWKMSGALCMEKSGHFISEPRMHVYAIGHTNKYSTG